MRNFAAIINETKPNALPLFDKLFNMLETIYKDDFKLLINTISDETEFVFTIGGDGTMVRALKEYPNIPTIGINAGTLGFLTEINEDNLEDACINILNKDYNVEYCTALEVDVVRNHKTIYNGISINDVVISRSNALSMIRFDIFINDKKIKQYNADGFIVSTPIGASAYSLSCGGPFIEPTSKLIELTPIAAHTLVNRSIVVDDEKEIKLVIIDSRNNQKNTLLSIDGEDAICLQQDDIITIKKANINSKLVRLHDDSFIENLSKKMYMI
jgi:NAD+ kinase